MADINSTPLNQPFLDNGFLSKAWERFLSAIGDGINGKWEYKFRKLASTNLTTQPDTQIVSYQGREVTISLIWNDGATFSNSSMQLSINSGKGDLTIHEGYLQVWNGSTLVEGALCSGLDISLPDLTTTTNKIIIQGRLLTRVRNPKEN